MFGRSNPEHSCIQKSKLFVLKKDLLSSLKLMITLILCAYRSFCKI